LEAVDGSAGAAFGSGAGAEADDGVLASGAGLIAAPSSLEAGFGETPMVGGGRDGVFESGAGLAAAPSSL
jgi:hypothetical protein